MHLEQHDLIRRLYNISSDHPAIAFSSYHDRIAHYPQIISLISFILAVARGGGLSKKKAQLIENDLLDSFSKLKGYGFNDLRCAMIYRLSTCDYDFEVKTSEGESKCLSTN